MGLPIYLCTHLRTQGLSGTQDKMKAGLATGGSDNNAFSKQGVGIFVAVATRGC